MIILSRPAQDIKGAPRRCCHRIILQEANGSDVARVIDAGLLIIILSLTHDDDDDKEGVISSK